MKRVLFVCLGNICRSPMAEAIFNSKVKGAGLEKKIEADSCGTAAYHLGQNPDPRTIQVVVDNDIPIYHKGRQLIKEDFNRFDYIIAMDGSNLSDILYLKPKESKARIHLMRDFDTDPESGEVPDPYYGGRDGFQHVYDILDRSSVVLLNQLKKLINESKH